MGAVLYAAGTRAASRWRNSPGLSTTPVVLVHGRACEECDDSDPEVNPDATETWYDGVDGDCNGGSDYDADGDGHDSADHEVDGEAGTDCDDANPDISPDGTDSWYDGVDSDCDGWSDYDADGDGHDSDSWGGEDCDDGDASSYPDAEEAFADFSGGHVSNAGDVDGDGLGDILVGASGNDDGGSSAGKVYLILGSSLGGTPVLELADADYSFIGESSGDAAQEVASAGDMDGDGLDDILMAGVGHGSMAGKVYLFLGSSLGSTSTIDLSDADYSFTGEGAKNYLGRGFDGDIDINGDGFNDILLGAHGNDDGGTDAGKGYLLLSGL